MATLVQINNDLNKAKELLETCGFLVDETVTVETFNGETNPSPWAGWSNNYKSLQIHDSSDNLIFRMDSRGGQGDAIYYGAYRSNGSVSRNYNLNGHTLVDGIGCKNGVFLKIHQQSTDTNRGCVHIFRNNHGKMTFVFNCGSSDYGITNNTNLCCTTWEDVAPYRLITLNGYSRMQTIIAPLLSDAPIDELSYTVKSGWMPYNRDYGIRLRTMTLNGHRFITDGRFAAEDEG